MVNLERIRYNTHCCQTVGRENLEFSRFGLVFLLKLKADFSAFFNLSKQSIL